MIYRAGGLGGPSSVTTLSNMEITIWDKAGEGTHIHQRQFHIQEFPVFAMKYLLAAAVLLTTPILLPWSIEHISSASPRRFPFRSSA